MTEDEARTKWKAWAVFGPKGDLFDDTVRCARHDAERLCGGNSTVRPVLISVDDAASQGGQTSDG